MNVNLAEAQSDLAQLIRRVQAGEPVVITEEGKPVAQLIPTARAEGTVVFDRQSEHVHLLPGWDDPIDLDRFLDGGL